MYHKSYIDMHQVWKRLFYDVRTNVNIYFPFIENNQIFKKLSINTFDQIFKKNVFS